VAKLIDVSRCIGCKACQAACMAWDDLRQDVGYFEGSYDNPSDLSPAVWTLMRFTEWENDQGNLEWLIRKDGCMHCADPGCLKACPAPGAIVQYANGIVDFISENCIGCGYCVKGCPFNIPRISAVDHKSYKCTLCSDRVSVGLEPACAKACPTGAIMFGSKADVTNWAGERIEDLKSRGFENAGLYDPPGVGGTHVMYVLHHADRPSLYAGLPDNPQISVLVNAWKGILKPVALAGIAFTAIAGFVHWIVAGSNEVQPADEAEAQNLLRRADRAEARPPKPEDAARRHILRDLSFAIRPRRGSTTGSPPPVSCCSCCPGFRCSTRCCSSCRDFSVVDNGRVRSIPGSG
jgi:formate dehydrogenase iron-sulfur subunit